MVDCRMNDEACAVDAVRGRREQLPSGIHDDQGGGSDLLEKEAVGVNQEVRTRAWQPYRHVGGQLVLPPVKGRQT